MKFKLPKIYYKKPLLFLGAFLMVAIFFIPFPAKAGIGDSIGSFLVSILSWLFMAFINIMGTLLLKAIELLIYISQYGDFIHNPIVDKGWVVVRDLANMALVVALLYMAFATVFKKGSYQYQNILPKIIVAAILINFSKTITGLAIDISQIFMMTFVNAFKDIAAGNLTYGFGIHDLLAFRETATGGLIGEGAGLDVNEWSILGATFLACLMVTIAFLVVISMVIMLLVRIIVLWFLVIFSPIAFMTGILPSEGGMSGYINQWRDTLTKWLIAGPTVAFMLWLSLAVISEMTEEKKVINLALQSAVSQGDVEKNPADWKAFANQVSGTQNMIDYLVTTGLMIATLVVASKTGVAGASFAGKAFGQIKGYGQKALSTTQRAAKRAAIGTTKWTATRPLKMARFGLSQIPENSKAFGILGAIARDRQADERSKKAKRKYAFLKKMGAGDETFEYLDHKYREKLENDTHYQQKIKNIKDRLRQRRTDWDEKTLEKEAKKRFKGGLNPLLRRRILIQEATSGHRDAKEKANKRKAYEKYYKEAKDQGKDEEAARKYASDKMKDEEIEEIYSRSKNSKPKGSKVVTNESGEPQPSGRIITDNIESEFKRATNQT